MCAEKLAKESAEEGKEDYLLSDSKLVKTTESRKNLGKDRIA